MKSAIDPRIQARRKEVREHGARRGLRKMIGLTVMLALVGSAVWLYQSSSLDVDAVVVRGAAESDPRSVLESRGIVVDQPILLSRLRADRAEAAVRDDPWVRDAVVRVQLPDTVVVEVIEYLPAAWASSADGWLLISPEGVVLHKTSAPGTALPHLDVGIGVVEPGSELDDPEVLGSLEFAAALGENLRQGVVVEMSDDELWATVDGHTVRLGRPQAMVDKAVALTALLAHGVEEGATVNLVAPTRPAIAPVTPPEPDREPLVEEEG